MWRNTCDPVLKYTNLFKLYSLQSEIKLETLPIINITQEIRKFHITHIRHNNISYKKDLQCINFFFF